MTRRDRVIKELHQEKEDLERQLCELEKKRKMCALLGYLIPLYESPLAWPPETEPTSS